MFRIICINDASFVRRIFNTHVDNDRHICSRARSDRNVSFCSRNCSREMQSRLVPSQSGIKVFELTSNWRFHLSRIYTTVSAVSRQKPVDARRKCERSRTLIVHCCLARLLNSLFSVSGLSQSVASVQLGPTAAKG